MMRIGWIVMNNENRIYALAIMILCMLLTIMPAVAASNLRGACQTLII